MNCFTKWIVLLSYARIEAKVIIICDMRTLLDHMYAEIPYHNSVHGRLIFAKLHCIRSQSITWVVFKHVPDSSQG